MRNIKQQNKHEKNWIYQKMIFEISCRKSEYIRCDRWKLLNDKLKTCMEYTAIHFVYYLEWIEINWNIVFRFNFDLIFFSLCFIVLVLCELIQIDGKFLLWLSDAFEYYCLSLMDSFVSLINQYLIHSNFFLCFHLFLCLFHSLVELDSIILEISELLWSIFN